MKADWERVVDECVAAFGQGIEQLEQLKDRGLVQVPCDPSTHISPPPKAVKHEIYCVKFEIDSTGRRLLTLFFRELESRRFGENDTWLVILSAPDFTTPWNFSGGNKAAWRAIQEGALSYPRPCSMLMMGDLKQYPLPVLAGILHGLRFHLEERL